MTSVFGDSYYFIALLNDQDGDHARALRLAHTLRSPIVTTEFVFVEVADALAGLHHRKSFSAFVEMSKTSPSVEVIGSSETLFEEGLELYDARPDKEWSLTDCISFVVMKRRQLTKALTADHHFEQAGFEILL